MSTTSTVTDPPVLFVPYRSNRYNWLLCNSASIESVRKQLGQYYSFRRFPLKSLHTSLDVTVRRIVVFFNSAGSNRDAVDVR